MRVSKKKKKVVDKKELELVMIRWKDAEAACEWTHASEAKKWCEKPFICSEVGWIYNEEGDDVCLTSQLGESEGLIGNRSKIPKSLIISRIKLSQRRK